MQVPFEELSTPPSTPISPKELLTLESSPTSSAHVLVKVEQHEDHSGKNSGVLNSVASEAIVPLTLIDSEGEHIVPLVSHISSLFIFKGFDFSKAHMLCTLLLRGWQHPLRVNSASLSKECLQFRKRTEEGCTYSAKLPVLISEGFSSIPFKVDIMQITVEFESTSRKTKDDALTQNLTSNLCMRVHPDLDSTDFIRINSDAFSGENLLSDSPELCFMRDRFVDDQKHDREVVSGFKIRWYCYQSTLKYAFEATVPVSAIWFCSAMLWYGGYDDSTNFQVLSTGLLSLIVLLQQQVHVGKMIELVYAIFLLCSYGLMFAKTLWPFCILVYAFVTPLLYAYSYWRYKNWLQTRLSDRMQFMQKSGKKFKSGELRDLPFMPIQTRLQELRIRVHQDF